MPNLPYSARFAVLAVAAGLSAAAFTTNQAGVKAESALEFLRNQHNQRSGQSTYSREPVEVERRGGGLFGFFHQFEYQERVAPRQQQASAPARPLQRAVCKRQCDGAQLALGFMSSRDRQKDAEAMCAAAGGGAETELVWEKFVPGAGFPVNEPVQTASAAPLQEGRASLDASATAKTTSGAGPCPTGMEEARFMTVPILHDTTLRNGDVVATRDGFKVFVGGGKPPFKETDFVDLESRKRVSADLRNLKVADR